MPSTMWPKVISPKHTKVMHQSGNVQHPLFFARKQAGHKRTHPLAITASGCDGKETRAVRCEKRDSPVRSC